MEIGWFFEVYEDVVYMVLESGFVLSLEEIAVMLVGEFMLFLVGKYGKEVQLV